MKRLRPRVGLIGGLTFTLGVTLGTVATAGTAAV
ncbi:MAG: hypothetical protein QOC80_1094, partial [Frankiaceae bacterium]|nr:hypothetical protein [Frankiaceae bacterium]